MDRLTALAEKIDSALRDNNSGGAVYDMLPAWVAEYEACNGMAHPGTSGGSGDLAHYMRQAGMEEGLYDEYTTDGRGNLLARIGRCVHRFDDAGFYNADLLPSVDMAREAYAEAAPNYDSGEEG